MQETLKAIKKQFLTFRNGIVADTLRNAGMDCYHIIFGLNLPQLTQIASSQKSSLPLALTLWDDKGVRESRLLAICLFPREEVDTQLALRLMGEVQTQEEADMLAFRLLRHLPIFPALKQSALKQPVLEKPTLNPSTTSTAALDYIARALARY